MSVAHPGAVGAVARRLGTGLAILALCAQLALGMVVPRQAAPSLASLFPWARVICHGDPAASHGPGKHPRPLPGWVVCPFCLALSVPLPHPASTAVLPRPVALWVAWRPLPPPARAPPPARTPSAAQPRAPPALT
jgi:hypothetical protein